MILKKGSKQNYLYETNSISVTSLKMVSLSQASCTKMGVGKHFIWKSFSWGFKRGLVVMLSQPVNIYTNGDNNKHTSRISPRKLVWKEQFFKCRLLFYKNKNITVWNTTSIYTTYNIGLNESPLILSSTNQLRKSKKLDWKSLKMVVMNYEWVSTLFAKRTEAFAR